MIFTVSRSVARAWEIERILAESRSHNLRREITGGLLSSGRYFAHIMEGDSTAIASTHSRILKDTRHDRIRVIFRGDIPKRRFYLWNMGFALAPDADALIESLVDGGPDPHNAARLGDILFSRVLKGK